MQMSESAALFDFSGAEEIPSTEVPGRRPHFAATSVLERDQKLLAMYMRGDPLAEIGQACRRLYRLDIPLADLASMLQTMVDDARHWRARPLARSYALVLFGGLCARIRPDGLRPAAIQSAIGVGADGAKELLGLWVAGPGLSPWSEIVRSLRARGIEEVRVAAAEASAHPVLAAEFPACHLVHHPRRLVRLEPLPASQRRAAAAVLESICTAGDGEASARLYQTLGREGWPPMLARELARRRRDVEDFIALPAALRRLIWHADVALSLGQKLRRRELGAARYYPDGETALLLLAHLLRHATAAWRVAPGLWKQIVSALPPPRRGRLRSRRRGLQAQPVGHADQLGE
jgi:transposase-like protein